MKKTTTASNDAISIGTYFRSKAKSDPVKKTINLHYRWERFAPPTSDTSRRAGKTHAMAELEDAFLECAPLAPRGGADDNIQVLVRVRPPNARELDQVRVAR